MSAIQRAFRTSQSGPERSRTRRCASPTTRSASYFEAHRDDFSDRQGRAVLSLISLPRPITAADSAATRQRAIELRNEIIGGVPFDTVARRESADSVSAAQGGLLGTVARGAFDPRVRACRVRAAAR